MSYDTLRRTIPSSSVGEEKDGEVGQGGKWRNVSHACALCRQGFQCVRLWFLVILTRCRPPYSSWFLHGFALPPLIFVVQGWIARHLSIHMASGHGFDLRLVHVIQCEFNSHRMKRRTIGSAIEHGFMWNQTNETICWCSPTTCTFDVGVYTNVIHRTHTVGPMQRRGGTSGTKKRRCTGRVRWDQR